MKDSKNTREYIIETAAPIFNRCGYVGTSLSDILDHTTLTKGAIYHNFENKDELALAALEYNLKLAVDMNFIPAMTRSHSCDKLAAFAGSFKDNYSLIKQMGGCPILNTAVDADDGNELMKDKIVHFIRMWKKAVMEIIENGISRNEIMADVNAETFATNFISLVEGGLAMSKICDDNKYIDNAVELIQELVETIKSR